MWTATVATHRFRYRLPTDAGERRRRESNVAERAWTGAPPGSQRARPANPMIAGAPAIASATPNTSALVGACRSTTHSPAREAAMEMPPYAA
jgi:hypothetical protein